MLEWWRSRNELKACVFACVFVHAAGDRFDVFALLCVAEMLWHCFKPTGVLLPCSFHAQSASAVTVMSCD